MTRGTCRCEPPSTTTARSLLYAKRAGKPLVLLAGHIDTVPAQGNLPGRIEDGGCIGLGATDMKGGARGDDRARALGGRGRARATTSRSSSSRARSSARPRARCPAFFERRAVVDEAAARDLLEPTDNTLQLGCLGNLNARLVFEGASAHSARPWLGVNAIALAVDGPRAASRALEPRDVEIDGLVFREVAERDADRRRRSRRTSIPARVEATLNFRYAPGPHARGGRGAPARARRARRGRDRSATRRRRTSPLRLAARRSALREAGELRGRSRSRRGRPSPSSPAQGLDAVNLGPGATRYAHARRRAGRDRASSQRTYEALQPLPRR